MESQKMACRPFKYYSSGGTKFGTGWLRMEYEYGTWHRKYE